jgi:hypothetical protein
MESSATHHRIGRPAADPRRRRPERLPGRARNDKPAFVSHALRAAFSESHFVDLTRSISIDDRQQNAQFSALGSFSARKTICYTLGTEFPISGGNTNVERRH